MSAHTMTTMSCSRRNARRRLIALALGVCALAVPASAAAWTYDSAPKSAPGAEMESSDSGLVAPDHTALNDSLAPLSGSQKPGVTGNSPTKIVYDSPSAGDGFDWGDAALGAGVTMALVAIGGTVLFAARRRPGVSPSALTS
jgi:hypothetical protein